MLGQLLVGPLSDASGRRPVLLCGSLAFAGLSVICAAAPTGPLLVLARLLQGLAAGGGVGAGRAVVSDHFSGTAAAQRYGTLASVTLLAPVIAPPVGSAILVIGSWRTVFAALAALGVAMVVAVVARVPESLPRAARQGVPRGALVTPLTGVLGYSTLRPMALLMSAFFAASAPALATARRPEPRRGRPGARSLGPWAVARP